MNKTGYAQELSFVERLDADEKYALVSHCIQLQGEPEDDGYRLLLERAGMDLSTLPNRDDFNNIHKIKLKASESTFSFIDLFAGIGGFRIAMQSLGGRCVFSSEWDEPAKETYFLNYGEVPFGDITKRT